MIVLISILALETLVLLLPLYIGAVLVARQDKKGESFFKVGKIQLRLRIPKPPPVQPPQQILADLEKEMKVVGTEITRLLGHRWMYDQIADMIRRNPALHVENSFYSWMRGQYSAFESMGIRRLVDGDDRSTSMKNILQRIIDNSHLFTLDRHAGFYTRSGLGRDIAVAEFARFSQPGAAVIDRAMVESDLRGIEAAAAPIRAFVNRRVAHTSRIVPGHLPTYADLHAALDTLKVFGEKYRLIVLCSGGDLTPTYVDDWHAPFRLAWDP